ncbi:vesicle-associated membrane protein 726 [Pyrus ussuriensis x Pyrus communis]|uniref:Vesicle-associated membrane protein 726 n=1 Tax=Pyrus ussuriensis x Pyrus communis TaxID=2448454 RepID=A0A5N5FNY8_9ROSA|nr:vesicle-associated membrane protein 726 [Pyrus ussuriensis x Pyrus communis]
MTPTPGKPMMPTWPLKKTDPVAPMGLGPERIIFVASDEGRVAVRLRPRNAEEMMVDVAQTSALRHVAFGLSDWQLVPDLSLGLARAPSPAHWACLLRLQHTLELL